MFYRIITAIFIGLIFFSANAQQKEQRVALVIGNSSYKSSPLKNPVNDARDMANSLRGYGFTVIERTNLTTRQVGSTLREFRSKLTPGSVAVVFYAGHGVQIKGENYLPTVDAEINGEEDVPMQSLSTRQVMDVLGEAKTRMNLVFLDACRDNPYSRSFRSGSRGIAKENAPSGTLISFATRPGSVAGDGNGRNGLYTSVLLEQIKQSNQPIEQVLKRVVSGVKVASKGQQEPWMEGSIEGDFCFGQCNQIGTSTLVNTNSLTDSEMVFWNSVKDSNDINELNSYLNKFPKGVFLSLALARINKIEQSRISNAPDVTLPNSNQNNPLNSSVAANNLQQTQDKLSHHTSRITVDAKKWDGIIESNSSQFIAKNINADERVNVVSFNRMVLLTGTVSSSESRLNIERGIAGILNVRAVVNELKIGPSSSFMDRANDMLLTSKASSALADQGGSFLAGLITVHSEVGRVFLLGIVTSQEAKRVTDIVRSVNGVKQIVRVFEYIPE